MDAIRDLLHDIPDPTLSDNERVRLRCQLAKQFEKTGNYAAACGAMDYLWAGVGLRPNLDALDKRTAAEVLLRVGVLSGWIGAIRLINGSQQMSRTLMTESIAIFEALNDDKKVAEAQTEMALCCMREGSLVMARTLFAEALTRLDDRDGDLKALAILRSAMVECLASRLNDALNLLTGGLSLFEASANHVLRGSFHNELAKVLRRMGVRENREDYVASVLREYTAASFYFEHAGHARYQGVVENNIAMFLLELERFSEAHEHLDRAQAIYTRLNDRFHLAGLEDSRAQVLLAEGEVLKAEKISEAAIRVLERSDQHSMLAEALTTRGVALSRLERSKEARETFERAIDTAEQSGDIEKAGLAAVSLLGLPGHQSLNFILHRRHPELLNSRTPIKPRRRSAFKLVAGGENQ